MRGRSRRCATGCWNSGRPSRPICSPTRTPAGCSPTSRSSPSRRSCCGTACWTGSNGWCWAAAGPAARPRPDPRPTNPHPSAETHGVTRPTSGEFGDALRALSATALRVADTMGAELDEALRLVRETVQRGGTLFFCGNGGSAADAQHLATEYVVRYMRNRRAYPAVALTTDSSLLTAAANDLGFDSVFARQVEALARPGDLLVIHSTSGNSPNVLRAAEAARNAGVRVLAFSARDGGALRALADHAVVVPTDRTDRAQELHLCIEHIICDVVEKAL
ncbi:MAG: SIS domain-containing protein [Gemmatimonadota bacterium]|nr:SIS domain-containing protein [Gemmatimonadota bacterium]